MCRGVFQGHIIYRILFFKSTTRLGGWSLGQPGFKGKIPQLDSFHARKIIFSEILSVTGQTRKRVEV